MDLSHILKDLRIVEESAMENVNEPPCPASKVLRQICERFEVKSEHGAGTLSATEQLFRSGDVRWLFSDADTDSISAYVHLVSSLTRHAALPVCETDSGTLPTSSYEDIPARARAVSAVLLALSLQLGSAVEAASAQRATASVWPLTSTLAPVMCVFAATHLQEQPWTSTASRKAASELLTSVVRAAGCGSGLELLCGKASGDQKGVLGAILDILQPELTKANWKRNQAVKHVFSWMLVQVGRPWLADHLEKVFPPSLLISDDYRTENKVLGVHCLHHIVLNVPAADLRQFNRAQVLYHALFNHLYTPEAPLIQVVLPCLVDLLSVLEKPPTHTGLPRKPNRYDEVLRLTLTHMEMEHKLALRRIYASSLVLFIQKMGIIIVRHLKRLERVIVGYLEVSDGPEEQARLSMLDALEKTLQVAWPRMESRMPVLARSLLRFLSDVSTEPLTPALREELMAKASRCLLLLDHCCQGRLKVLLGQVDSSCAAASVLESLQRVAQSQ